MQHRVLIATALGVAVASMAFLVVRTAPNGDAVEPVSIVRAAERADSPDGVTPLARHRDPVVTAGPGVQDAGPGGFELPPVGSTLLVHVVERSTGRDLPGVRLACRRPGEPAGAPGRRRAPVAIEGPHGTIERDPLTGRDGRAVLDLPAGERLRLSVDGRPSHVEPLAVGERRELVVELGDAPPDIERVAGSPVTGLLLEGDGSPVRGRRVWIVRAESPTPAHLSTDAEPFARAETDAEGRFSFPNVPTGEWWIGPAPLPEGGIAPYARWFRVPTGARRVEVELEAHRGHSIRGAVIAADERPIAGTRVWARELYGSGRVWATIDRDGSFVLAPIAPGHYEVGVDFDVSAGHSSAKPGLCRSGSTDVRLELR